MSRESEEILPNCRGAMEKADCISRIVGGLGDCVGICRTKWRVCNLMAIPSREN